MHFIYDCFLDPHSLQNSHRSKQKNKKKKQCVIKQSTSVQRQKSGVIPSPNATDLKGGGLSE